MSTPIDRRTLLAGAALSGLATSLPSTSQGATTPVAEATQVPLPPKANVGWPIWDDTEVQRVLSVLQSGRWGRAGGGITAPEFEATFGKIMEAKHCIATTSGTTALFTVMGAAGVGPGDEVIIPPYTFVATFNAITMNYALPVFADIDRSTFQIDPKAIAKEITDQTKVIMPVHIGGSVADLDRIQEVAKPKNLPIIEDACQAPMAQWRGKPVGSYGLAGCISFQSSKNVSAGEGGAILTNDAAFASSCYDFHTPGGGKRSPLSGRGANFRITEFQAAVLLAQLTRAAKQYETRNANAKLLTKLLKEIPGIYPAELTDGCTQSAWHLYMLRFDSEKFGGMTRAAFLQEIAKAGAPASGGYTRLHVSPHINALAENPHYLKIYGKDFMQKWLERNQCPENDKLCEEAVWFSQTQLLAPQENIERMAEAIAAVQKKAAG